MFSLRDMGFRATPKLAGRFVTNSARLAAAAADQRKSGRGYQLAKLQRAQYLALLGDLRRTGRPLKRS